MKKELPFNRFGECILREYHLFDFRPIEVKRKYSANSNCDLDIYKMKFNWTWDGYEGYGELDFSISKGIVCNYYGEKNSFLSVYSYSKELSHGRYECGIHNDETLELLFNRMLQALDISKYIRNEV
ncbi:MAG: hypothetical protein E7515_02735 [Ruminococcaceae bacterium]|nr:hypothetical protein [Oscillospiraceae bacterium]